MKKLILALLIPTLAWAVPIKMPEDSLTLGKLSSAATKSIEFELNAGANNTKLKSNPANLDLQLITNRAQLGKGDASNKRMIFDRGGSNPEIRWNESSGKLEHSNNGSSFTEMGQVSDDKLQVKNLITSNPEFEDGLTGWTNSGGTFSAVSSGSNLLYGAGSATFDASASGQYIETGTYAVPYGLDASVRCYARVYYKGGDANLKLRVLTSANSLVAEKVLVTSSSARIFDFPFTCPAATMLIKLRLESTANAAIVSVDRAILGDIPNLGQNEVVVYSATSHGSTNTHIRIFDTVQINAGLDISYATSATLGDTFTINTAGVYSITYTDLVGTNGSIGLSINSSQLTTSITGITEADRLSFATNSTSFNTLVSVTRYFSAGDVIRAHDDSASQSNASSKFSIVRVN